MRSFIVLLLVVFCVTLAVVIGNRMSTEAMAVVIGVVCGVVASIPMSIILLVATGRLGRAGSGETIGAGGNPAPIAGQAYPPVVIIGPGASPYGLMGQPYMVPSTPRRFEIVGDEAE